MRRMRDLKAAGFQTRDISLMVEDSRLMAIKPGLYRLSDIPKIGDLNSDFIDVRWAIKNSVICRLSALAHYELTTFNPW